MIVLIFFTILWFFWCAPFVVYLFNVNIGPNLVNCSFADSTSFWSNKSKGRKSIWVKCPQNFKRQNKLVQRKIILWKSYTIWNEKLFLSSQLWCSSIEKGRCKKDPVFPLQSFISWSHYFIIRPFVSISISKKTRYVISGV